MDRGSLLSSDDTALELVGYVRVPSSSWHPTVQEQERALHAWARSERHHVVAIVRDLGGMRLAAPEHRIGLRKALSTISDGGPSGLLVYQLNVLDERITVQEAVFGQIWGRGGEAFTCDSGWIDPRRADSEARATAREAVRVLMGMWQQGTARQRQTSRNGVRAGIAPARSHRAEAGGAPAFGYRADAGLRVADPREQATLIRILELRQRGLSLRSIADTLTAEGHLPKRSERWHPENLRRILRRLDDGGL